MHRIRTLAYRIIDTIDQYIGGIAVVFMFLLSVVLLVIAIMPKSSTVEKYNEVGTVISKRSETSNFYNLPMSYLLNMPVLSQQEDYYLTIMLDDDFDSLVEVSVDGEDFSKFNKGNLVLIEVTKSTYESGRKSYEYEFIS